MPFFNGVVMSTKVTLTIPEHVYEQARRIAQEHHRPLADVLNEALVEAFPSVHVNPQRDLMEREQAAFQAQHSQLLKKYPDKYIAMFQGEVIDHDDDRVALVTRIDNSHPHHVVLIKFVTDQPEKIINVRSPRLLKNVA